MQESHSARQPCVYEDLFLPSHRCLTPPSWGTSCDINAIYTSLKSTYSGLQFRPWQYGSIFIRLAVIASETREFDLTAVQGYPRSSILVSMESPYMYVINYNFSRMATVFEIFTLKDRKLLILPTPTLFDAPLGVDPLEFLDETYPTKTRVVGLPYVENFIIPNFNVFVWYTRVTDGRTGDSVQRAKHIIMLPHAIVNISVVS